MTTPLNTDTALDEIVKQLHNDSAHRLYNHATGDKCETRAKAKLQELLIQSRLDELQTAQSNIKDSNHFTPEVADSANGDYITIYRGKCFECHIKDRIAELQSQLKSKEQ